MNTNAHNEARGCLIAIGTLAAEASRAITNIEILSDITPIRVLLDRSEALLNGNAEARDRKNAGDRKRRARTKAPGKKPAAKNPSARPASA